MNVNGMNVNSVRHRTSAAANSVNGHDSDDSKAAEAYGASNGVNGSGAAVNNGGPLHRTRSGQVLDAISSVMRYDPGEIRVRLSVLKDIIRITRARWMDAIFKVQHLASAAA